MSGRDLTQEMDLEIPSRELTVPEFERVLNYQADIAERLAAARKRRRDEFDPTVINSPAMAAQPDTYWSGALSARPRYVRPPSSLRMTRADRLKRYGPSLAVAAMNPSGEMFQNRLKDEFWGKGRYRRKRARGRGKYTFGSFIRDVESVGRRAEGTANRFLTKGLPRVLGAAKSIGLGGSGLYSGRGMYNQNVLIEGGDAPMTIGMGATDNQEVVINHCEYLQDVYGPGSAAFTNNSLDLNPGLLENFPFLAQIAANYEEYEFLQLMFHFKSTVDAAQSATGAVGTIIMATNYNADAASFLSKESMMQYHGANNTRIDSGMDHGVECDPTKNAGTAIRYVRTVPLVDGQQKKEFDLGKFQWAIVNIPTNFQNQQLGELWVSYTVKLGKPKLAVALGRTIAEDRFVSNGGESTTSILGTQLLKLSQSNIGTVWSEIAGSPGNVTLKVTFPNFLTGRFEILIKKVADDLGVSTYTPAGNVSLVSDIWVSTQYVYALVFGSTGYHSAVVLHCDVRPATAGVDNTLTFACTGVAAGECEITVRPYNPDLQLKWKSVADGSDVVPA